jgi:GntR family transcriptional regulator
MQPFPIERENSLPVYVQIRQRLLDRITSGELKAGDVIPSEQRMCATLGVSRMTVRQAVKSLCDLGIVYSLQGKGTFISPIKLEKNFRQVQSFTEEMRALGRRPGSKLLRLRVEAAPAKAAEALKVATGTEIVRLDRLRLANSEPMGIERAYLVHALCPGLATIFDSRGSLYRTLWEHFGIRLAVADEIVEVGLPGASEARLLRVSPKKPVFLFTRVSYARRGHSMQAVEYVKSTYRGDRYKIVSRLTRAKLTGVVV